MIQRYLTRACFALLLTLSVLANHGNLSNKLGLSEISSGWNLSNGLSGMVKVVVPHQ